MSKINIDNWKEFDLVELFDVEGSITTPKNDLDLSNDKKYPYITTAATNNGVAGYSNKYTDNGNILTVDSAVLGTTFYQKENFTASDHVEKLVPRFELTENVGLFLCSVLNGTARKYNYAYNEKRSQKALKKEKIILPVDENGDPDWIYMENFISIYKKEVEKTFHKVKQIANYNTEEINISDWKKFHLYDEGLFDIDMGSKLDKSKMTENNPTINFVGRANANNGITTKVDEIEALKPYSKGNLTVSLGGEYLGSCFIQPEDFYTSQNVIVLIPKWEMSFEVKQFISIMVFKESRTHYKAFIDELNKHIKTDFSFYLPVDDKGNPNWKYMESYIKDLTKICNNSFELMRKI